jgi:UDP-N-acetylglucosamine diphosphorylase/glucosamine-1-phosphate N-acetyltransferase
MNFILFDGAGHEQLKPFTFTRAVADLRIGITTLRQKWEHFLQTSTHTLTAPYLQSRYTCEVTPNNLLVNAAVLPNKELLKELLRLDCGQKLVKSDVLIGLCMDQTQLQEMLNQRDASNAFALLDKFDGSKVRSDFELTMLKHPWELFTMNGQVLQQDFHQLTSGRKSARIPSSNRCSGDAIFLEEGAKVEHAVLNSNPGPIYIGKEAEVMEGSMVRGGLALGDHSVLKMGAKIYGPTTIGPFSKVGGELSNSVILGYSNKGHDGFIGNSVIGEWCNLGADTNGSNLKNNYSPVRVWSYTNNTYVETGQQFCGVLMGDHSKTGINTMLNTGTVMGVSCNVFGGGFPPKYIPSFAWGGDTSWQTFMLDKAAEVAERMMERRGVSFTSKDRQLFEVLFEQSADDRKVIAG